ncbi:MAG: phosphotransferase [Ilumatobacteraceae bacterium]
MLESPTSVELADARTFLIERFGVDSREVEVVGEGAWSRCYGFVLGDGEMVIRFGRHLEDFQRDRIAARFAARDLPVPQVTEIDAAFGGWYCISTRAHGTPLEQLDDAAWAATAPSVLSTLDALRRADISATTGYGPWNHAGNAPHSSWTEYLTAVIDDQPGSRFHGWKQRLQQAPGGDASFGRAHERMVELADGYTSPRHLIHNDLLNRNALASEGSVTSVFDWGCSIYGDFVYELATFVFWSPWHAAIKRTDLMSTALDHYGDMGLDVPNFHTRLRCCALHIGLVHLAYNAFLGDLETLRLTDERMSLFLDG